MHLSKKKIWQVIFSNTGHCDIYCPACSSPRMTFTFPHHMVASMSLALEFRLTFVTASTNRIQQL